MSTDDPRQTFPVEPIGDRVRRLREQRGLSQRQLAGPGISNSYLSRIEKGERVPSVPVIRAVAARLGVSAEYLETGGELSAREERELRLRDVELAMRLGAADEEQAAPRFEVLIAEAADAGDDDLAVKAKASYGVALWSWGHLREAAGLLEQALCHPFALPEVFTEAYVALIVTYLRLGRDEDAVHLCEEALARTPENAGAVRVVLSTHLSNALSDLGDIARAEAVLADIAGDIDDADPYTRARMHWSQARLAAMTEKRRLALRHMEKAIALLEGTEDTLRVARAHLQCAQILLRGGRTDGVCLHLETAERLLGRQPMREEAGRLHALQALLAAREDDVDRAGVLAAEALRILGENVVGQVEAWCALALSLTAGARYDEADSAFGRALAIVEREQLWREAAAIARDRGRAREAAGDASGALAWKARAAELSVRARKLRSAIV